MNGHCPACNDCAAKSCKVMEFKKKQQLAMLKKGVEKNPGAASLSGCIPEFNNCQIKTYDFKEGLKS